MAESVLNMWRETTEKIGVSMAWVGDLINRDTAFKYTRHRYEAGLCEDDMPLPGLDEEISASAPR